jgi:hypothetical protein
MPVHGPNLGMVSGETDRDVRPRLNAERPPNRKKNGYLALRCHAHDL